VSKTNDRKMKRENLWRKKIERDNNKEKEKSQ